MCKRSKPSRTAWWLLALAMLTHQAPSASGQGLPGRYHRYIEMRSALRSLRNNHPQIMRLDTLGYSTRYNIPVLRVRLSDAPNSDQDKPVALICGGAHANEVLGPEVVLGFIQDIIGRYDSGDTTAQRLIGNLEIFLVPMVNPEGHIVVENGNLDWRKNQCDNDSNGVFNFHDGVDNNRNYDMGWELANDPKSVTPESSMYRGTAPFTQTENNALRDFGWHYHPVVALDYHSPAYGLGEVAYYPWYWRQSDGGQGAAPDEPMMADMARQFASLIVNDQGDSTYRARRAYVEEGDFNTYFYGNFGSVVFTVEVSDTTIQDGSMVDNIVARNIPAIYFPLQRALRGRITGVVRDSITLEPLEAEVRVLERNNPDINSRMTRADFGCYDRILESGTYTLGFFKSGYYPRQINNVNVAVWPVVNDVMLMPMAPRPPAPILQFPSDGQTMQDNQFTFDWADVDIADRYLIEVATDSLFASIMLNDSNITASQFPLPATLSDGHYFWRVKGGNENGWGPYSEAFDFFVDAQSAIDNPPTPVGFSLSQNYPNPFNARTTISYYLSNEAIVSLYIFSLNGELVDRLLDKAVEAPGEHRLVWDASDNRRQSLSSGIYFYRLSANNHTRTKAMVMVK